MKHTLNLLVLLLVCNFGYSQIYYSHYLDATSEWRTYHTDAFGTSYYTSFFDGTEDHNGYTYYKKFTIINEYGNIYLYPSYSLYREDNNGKFYYLNLNTNTDEVDLDNNTLLNAQIGDSFNSLGVLYYDNENCPVTTVNTINLNGLSLKHLIGTFDGTTGVIEGIGRISNPCFPSLDSWGGLSCYTKQNQTIQFTPNIDCNLFPNANRQGLSTLTYENSNFNVFPNPTRGLLTIVSKDAITAVDVFDHLGRKVNQFSAIQNNQIDLSHLEDGIYFIEIISTERKVVQKLILKK